MQQHPETHGQVGSFYKLGSVELAGHTWGVESQLFLFFSVLPVQSPTAYQNQPLLRRLCVHDLTYVTYV